MKQVRPKTTKPQEKNTRQKKIALDSIINIGVTVTVLFVILSFITIRSVRTSTVENYSDLISAEMPYFAQNIGFQLNQYVDKMNMYTQSEVVQHGSEQEIIDWLRSAEDRRPEGFKYMSYVSESGTAYLDNGRQLNVKSSNYFLEMKHGADMFIDNAALSKADAQSSVTICAAAYNANGSEVGFFAGEVSLQSFIDFATNVQVGNDGYLIIIDGNGVITGHPDELYLMRNLADSSDYEDLADFYDAIKDSDEGMEEVTDGDAWYNFYYARVPDLSWQVILIIPQKELYSIANSLRNSLSVGNFLIAVVILFLAGITISRSLKPLLDVQHSITEIASGDADLTRRIEIKSNNEIGALATGMNAFITKLQEIIANVKTSKDELEESGAAMNMSISETGSAVSQMVSNIKEIETGINGQSESVSETAGAINQIAENIRSLERMIEKQAAGIEQASSAVEEMIGNIGSVNTSVERMSESFTTLSEHAQMGDTMQQDVNKQIQTISEQSSQLASANKVIANIANQTNLLAMNAAIEAAHAGEAGKGFSVVADEIRKLSETSSMQSKTIGNQLKNITASINTVADASSKSGQEFDNIVRQIKLTNQLVEQIKGAMQEQQAGSRQIGEALRSMNDSTAEVRTASREMTEGQQSIIEEVRRLQDDTGAIRQQVKELSNGTETIQTAESNLEEIAKGVKNSIDNIGSQIDLFRV